MFLIVSYVLLQMWNWLKNKLHYFNVYVHISLYYKDIEIHHNKIEILTLVHFFFAVIWSSVVSFVIHLFLYETGIDRDELSHSFVIFHLRIKPLNQTVIKSC